MATGQTITAAPPTVVSVQAAILKFIEAGAATYTGSLKLPADAILIDIIVVNDTLWALGHCG